MDYISEAQRRIPVIAETDVLVLVNADGGNIEITKKD